MHLALTNVGNHFFYLSLFPFPSSSDADEWDVDFLFFPKVEENIRKIDKQKHIVLTSNEGGDEPIEILRGRRR